MSVTQSGYFKPLGYFNAGEGYTIERPAIPPVSFASITSRGGKGNQYNHRGLSLEERKSKRKGK